MMNSMWHGALVLHIKKFFQIMHEIKRWTNLFNGQICLSTSGNPKGLIKGLVLLHSRSLGLG